MVNIIFFINILGSQKSTIKSIKFILYLPPESLTLNFKTIFNFIFYNVNYFIIIKPVFKKVNTFLEKIAIKNLNIFPVFLLLAIDIFIFLHYYHIIK